MGQKFNAFALAIGGALISMAAIGSTGFANSGTGSAEAGCEILASRAGSGLALEAVFHAEQSVSGSYQLSVQSVGSGNRTNINQGGGFSARAGEVLTLGRSNVGGASAYDVALTVDAGGTTVKCSERFTV